MRAADVLFPRGIQRVLAPIMLNPEREFRHNELVAMAGPGRGSGQNAVRAVLEAGIASSRRSGNQLLVSANRSHPIFGELRSICLKSFGVADRLREALSPWAGEVDLAFLFGSIVKGTDRADSDIDLIVVGSPDLMALHGAIDRAEADLGRPVHFSVYGRDEWGSLEKEPVMASIISGAKVMVVGNDPAA
jgi:predicted nucleotidyltransferase